MGEPGSARSSEQASRGRMLPDLWHEPIRELENLWERMGQVFDPGWATATGQLMARTGGWQPMVDVEETADSYVFEADLPGVRREDISVELRDHDLWISGELREKEHAGVLHRKTRRTGSFSYRTTLPSEVDPDQVEASLDNGVLTVRVRKAEAATPRQIEIR